MQADNDAYHAKASAKYAEVKPRYTQLVVVTDGEDSGDSVASADAVRTRLGAPGAWAARCRFKACLVGVGASASGVLEGLGAGLRHVEVLPVEDGPEAIKGAFKRVVNTIRDTLVTLVTTTSTAVKLPGGGRPGTGGGGGGLGALTHGMGLLTMGSAHSGGGRRRRHRKKSG
jgi:hypothetical protein